MHFALTAAAPLRILIQISFTTMRNVRGRMSFAAPTLLVVDDDVAIRDLLAVVLARAGYVALCASDGLEAAEHLRRHPVDLILTDVYMPGEDGFYVLRVAAERRVGVVVFTAERDAEFDPLRQAQRLGARAVLRKPLDAELILRTVRACLTPGGHDGAACAA
jgi:CheY-like chemotaxis protein